MRPAHLLLYASVLTFSSSLALSAPSTVNSPNGQSALAAVNAGKVVGGGLGAAALAEKIYRNLPENSGNSDSGNSGGNFGNAVPVGGALMLGDIVDGDPKPVPLTESSLKQLQFLYDDFSNHWKRVFQENDELAIQAKDTLRKNLTECYKNRSAQNYDECVKRQSFLYDQAINRVESYTRRYKEAMAIEEERLRKEWQRIEEINNFKQGFNSGKDPQLNGEIVCKVGGVWRYCKPTELPKNPSSDRPNEAGSNAETGADAFPNSDGSSSNSSSDSPSIDTTKLQNSIDRLAQRFDSIETPKVDTSRLQSSLDGLANKVNSVSKPQELDTSEVQSSLDKLGAAFTAIVDKIQGLSIPGFGDDSATGNQTGEDERPTVPIGTLPAVKPKTGAGSLAEAAEKVLKKKPDDDDFDFDDDGSGDGKKEIKLDIDFEDKNDVLEACKVKPRMAMCRDYEDFIQENAIIEACRIKPEMAICKERKPKKQKTDTKIELGKAKEDAQQLLEFCKQNPNRLFCIEVLGEVADIEMQNNFDVFDGIFQQMENNGNSFKPDFKKVDLFSSSATCPAPLRISFSGNSAEISFELLCEFLEMIRGVILLISGISSMMIVIRGLRN